MDETKRGELPPGTPHPMATSAVEFIYSLGLAQLAMWQESFDSSAIDGNEMAEVLGETLRRLLAHEPASDRYVLGLAWYLKEFSNLGTVL